MAVLTDGARAEVWAEAMREVSAEREPIGVTKPELRAAVNAIDSFLDSNMAALNSAIPQPARNALTTAQKARLLKMVITRRYLDGA